MCIQKLLFQQNNVEKNLLETALSQGQEEKTITIHGVLYTLYEGREHLNEVRTENV